MKVCAKIKDRPLSWETIKRPRRNSPPGGASKLIERAVLTQASPHDSQAMDEQVAPDGEVVLADSAYCGAHLEHFSI